MIEHIATQNWKTMKCKECGTEFQVKHHLTNEYECPNRACGVLATKENLVKKIDMSVCIESGVDCTFYVVNEPMGNDKLVVIEHGQYEGLLMGQGFYNCRVRQDHWFYSPDGFSQCPVPEGLHLYVSTGYSREHMHQYMHLEWSQIKAFKVTGVAEGWEY